MTTIVLPLAGRGTRLLPLTLKTPKNLIEVNGKPLLEYALLEAYTAGLRRAILIVSPDHADYFENYLWSARTKFPEMQFIVRLQDRPFGHGHALLQAADLLGRKPFIVRFPDDILTGRTSAVAELVRLYREKQASAVLLEEVPEEMVSRFGIVKIKPLKKEPGIQRILGMIEKPKTEEAPSRLAIVGAYALSPRVLTNLKRLGRKMKAENDALLISDGLLAEIRGGGSVFGLGWKGMRLDCGTLDNLVKTRELLTEIQKVES